MDSQQFEVIRSYSATYLEFTVNGVEKERHAIKGDDTQRTKQR